MVHQSTANLEWHVGATANRAERRRARPLRILVGAGLTALAAPGGGEIQMLKLVETLPALDVEARLWRPWEDALDEADCLHLFGSHPEHIPVIEAAHRRGVPVALSTIAWFDWANCWREPAPVWRKLARTMCHAARACLPAISSWRRHLYHAADLLLPNSQAEARQLERLFGIPKGRIQVVPNGADPRFAQADPRPFQRLVGPRPFALYAGRIEPRKNQLNFLRALHGMGVPIVILGNVVPGHEAYEAECRRMAGPDCRFLGRLEHDDPLLASAYAAAGCLVLASWFETPGLVALEAGMTGTPLVLPAGGSAREYFGEMARYVRPHDLSGIRRAVSDAMATRADPALAQFVQRRFTWRAAAASTLLAYERLAHAHVRPH